MKNGLSLRRYSPLLLLIFSTVAAFGQSSNKYDIDSVRIYFNRNLDKFLSDINHDKFQVYDSKKAIPTFIEEELNYLTGGFSLANPKEEFQC
jgi:hypothetical protein